MQRTTVPLDSSGLPEGPVPWVSLLNSPCLAFPIWEMGPRLLLWPFHWGIARPQISRCSSRREPRGLPTHPCKWGNRGLPKERA